MQKWGYMKIITEAEMSRNRFVGYLTYDFPSNDMFPPLVFFENINVGEKVKSVQEGRFWG